MSFGEFHSVDHAVLFFRDIFPFPMDAEAVRWASKIIKEGGVNTRAALMEMAVSVGVEFLATEGRV